MLEDRSSRVALAVSLLLHGVLAAPVWERWSPLAADPAPVVAAPPAEPITFRLVDPQPGPDARPDVATPNVSDADRRAAQPDAPEDLPAGEAFSPGTSPIPSTPRPAGTSPRAASPPAASPAAASPPAASSPSRADAAEAAADEARPESRVRSPSRPQDAPTRDWHSARKRIGARRESPSMAAESGAPPGARLPAPEVDQRLTRAEAGSAFSLNTTAWEWAPYMQRLKARIEEHISPPAAFYYGTAAWISRVRFRIGPDGRLMDFRLLDHRGVENLQYVALDAITGAADYEPLPPGFPEPYLEITGNFYFNVFPSDGP